MQPFLQSIAQAYLEHESVRLMDMCFVFPNKRSATFFTDYLNTIAKGQNLNVVHPATTTIVDFIEDFSTTAAGDRMELIFILYDVYREVVKRHHGEKEAAGIDFNKFIYWADILLNDFDDVDNSLADTSQLFRNVTGLKEISANYLTPEQIEVMRHFYSDEKIPQEVRDFWNHIAHGSGGNTSESVASVGFLRLWQVMGEIYEEFHRRTGAMGLHTPGRASREVAEYLGGVSADALPFRRYVFIGFNNLSRAEKTIFDSLRRLTDEDWGTPLADFYWDTASPAFDDVNFAGGMMVKKYAAEFPSLYDCVPAVDGYPKIEVTGVPSRVGQGKAIGRILESLYPSGKPVDLEQLRRTAIVMPEENMLIPLMNSLPANISPLNITMGYRLRNTAVAGLVRDVVSMQMRSYQNKFRGTFFHEDVINVLSHPLVRSFRPDLCTRLLLEIQQRRLFNVPATLFSEPRFAGMEPVFSLVSDKNSVYDVFSYLDGLLQWIADAFAASPRNACDNDRQDTETPSEKADDSGCHDDTGAEQLPLSADVSRGRNVALQEAFLRRYANAVGHLRDLCGRYLSGGKVYIEDATVFNLVERIIQGEMLNFEGVPLQGLQLIGVLEARSIDFDTLIIPSMNERVFPRAKFTGSFIPVVLRSSYGLPTPDDQENVYSYFFYRMISRARRVFLLYDARSTGLKSRQMSRYIRQLMHIFKPKGLKHTVLPYRMSSPQAPEIGVRKTPEIMAVINRYRSATSPLYLSASSIKQYVGCPMSFYFEKIAHYRREDEINDWMDESTMGQVVHYVFETLFGNLLAGHESGVTVTAEMLGRMRDNQAALDRIICVAVNKFYRKLGEDCHEPLTGESKLMGYIIKENIREVLRKEQPNTPFTYISGEWPGKNSLTITGSTGNSATFNFLCFIDRIDRFSGDSEMERIRVIDYKTGTDETSVPSLESIFKDYKKKAFLQVMLYAQAYAQFNGYDGPIQPMIYAMRNLMVSPITPLGVPAPVGEVEFEELKKPATARGKWRMLDYRDYVAQFNDLLIPYIEELFDPDKPFMCTDDENACKYCAFKAICRKDN